MHTAANAPMQQEPHHHHAAAPAGAGMMQAHGWWFPAHERHLPEWMSAPKNALELNGRRAYQGRKQMEARTAATAAAALRGHAQPRTAVDVGAHVGLWTWNLAHWFGIVHAFEPVPLHRECWLRNMAGPTLPGRLHLHPCALGEQPGAVAMHTEPTSSGDTRVHGAGDTPMRTLDSYELQDVDFLKIDCEGYEEHVLRGAVDTLERCRPVVCVEQKHDHAERFGLHRLGAVKLLQAMGWRVAREISGDYIMVAA